VPWFQLTPINAAWKNALSRACVLFVLMHGKYLLGLAISGGRLKDEAE
jgi:hypothetical protein